LLPPKVENHLTPRKKPPLTESRRYDSYREMVERLSGIAFALKMLNVVKGGVIIDN